jgi:hypothetical protein
MRTEASILTESSCGILVGAAVVMAVCKLAYPGRVLQAQAGGMGRRSSGRPSACRRSRIMTPVLPECDPNELKVLLRARPSCEWRPKRVSDQVITHWGGGGGHAHEAPASNPLRG